MDLKGQGGRRARTYTRGRLGVKLSSSTDHQVRGAILKGSQDEERGPSSMAQFTRHGQCQ